MAEPQHESSPTGRLAALTGGTGFVGSHVAEALLREGWRVRALVRRPDAPGWLKGLDVETVRGDVRDPASLGQLVEGAQAVVHVAGKTAARNEAEYLAANAGGVANVAAATRAAAPKAHVVLVSSLAAAGPSRRGRPVRTGDPDRPVSAYGRSKLEGERRLAESGLGRTVLRPGAVYGPRETAIRDLFVGASRGWVPLIAGGRPQVQLVFAPDVADAVLGALRRGPTGETFFVAHPEILDYRRIADTLAELRVPRARLLPVPAPLVRAAGAVVGLATSFASGPPVFNREKARELLQEAWTCDVSDTQEALGQPFKRDFLTGSRITWEWYRDAGWIR